MKTDVIKKCVTDWLCRLQRLPAPQQRAELAELRRGVGRQPGDLPTLWGSLLEQMPGELRGRDGPSEAEWAIYLTLTLFALHEQGADGDSMNQLGQTLGTAVRKLAQATSEGDWTESSVLRRFNALATSASMPELSNHLRGIVRLLRQKEIKLDYPQLAADLYRFQFAESAANVRLQWGRDLYRIFEEETKEKEN